MLQEHLYADEKYDKWANVILPSGKRLIGELFHDPSVQKILAVGGVLDLFTPYVKHPRTYHLPWSEGATDDDKTLPDVEALRDVGDVVVTVKLDGEQTTMYKDHIHARSTDGDDHPSRHWVKNLWSGIKHEIPRHMRVCGENVYAQHTVAYERLSTYFYVHSIWEGLTCLAWPETETWAALFGLQTVPVLYTGRFNEDRIKRLYTPTINGDRMEGYVVRPLRAFTMASYRTVVGKYVAADFRRDVNAAGHHWRAKAVVKNGLATEATT